MRRLLFLHLLFLWSCGALPLRIDSGARPSREPELELVPEQNLADYARTQTEVLLHQESAADKGSADAYKIYQNGGRDFIRALFRSLRDANLNEDQSWVMNEKLTRTLEGGGCISLSPDDLLRDALSAARVTSTFPLLGWEFLQLSDPDGWNTVHEKNGADSAAALDDWHRLIFFESGIRVRGSRLKAAGRNFLELTYKVVHEKGEAKALLKRDEWGTRLTFDLHRQDSKHQSLLITTETGAGLYEDSRARVDLRHELLITWNDEGPRSRFRMQLMANNQLQAFHLLHDREQDSITLGWQVNETIRQFKLYPSSTGRCHGG